MSFFEQRAADTPGPTCYRHPGRPATLRCSNCDRPICTDCMRDSPVGQRCPECAPQRSYVLRDDYLVTKVILAICVVVYLAGMLLDALQPSMGGRGGDELIVNGGLAGAIIQSEPWRLVTSGFLHAGLLHLAFNGFFIWSFGRLLEPVLGPLRFGLLYAAGLAGGSLGAILLTNPFTLTVGASGAAFGLLGATLVLSRVRGIAELQQNLLMIAGINFVLTFTISGISVGGHVGGFAAGLLAGALLFSVFNRDRRAAAASVGGLAVALFVLGFVLSGDTALLATTN